MTTNPVPLVMVLEDEALIALDVENTLADADLGRTEVFSSCAEAIKWLADHTPDVAVIDIFLRDGECMEVAQVLVERSVPFVVHTARKRPAHESHRVFLNGQWLSKPCKPMELSAAVKRCATQGAEKYSAIQFHATRGAVTQISSRVLDDKAHQKGRFS